MNVVNTKNLIVIRAIHLSLSFHDFYLLKTLSLNKYVDIVYNKLFDFKIQVKKYSI